MKAEEILGLGLISKKVLFCLSVWKWRTVNEPFCMSRMEFNLNSLSSLSPSSLFRHSSLYLKISLVKAPPEFSESIVKANHNFISTVFWIFQDLHLSPPGLHAAVLPSAACCSSVIRTRAPLLASGPLFGIFSSWTSSMVRIFKIHFFLIKWDFKLKVLWLYCFASADYFRKGFLREVASSLVYPCMYLWLCHKKNILYDAFWVFYR